LNSTSKCIRNIVMSIITQGKEWVKTLVRPLPSFCMGQDK
jgi:hypothetical protein